MVYKYTSRIRPKRLTIAFPCHGVRRIPIGRCTATERAQGVTMNPNGVPLSVLQAVKEGGHDIANIVKEEGQPGHHPLSVEEFNTLITTKKALVVDVRSPAEFKLGHIPGANSIPLFDNEQRKLVGTAYKKKGKESAMTLGLDLVQGNFEHIISTTRDLFEKGECDVLLVYCWRGGLRSASMAWLFKEVGFNCKVLCGGYKGYRSWAHSRWDLEQKATSPNICIIGGRTGVGKTKILKCLEEKFGQQVLDLEGLANHKGSTFGWVGEDKQPTTEHFLNVVAWEWQKFDPQKWLFIEDEGMHVGHVHVPDNLYESLRKAPIVMQVECSRESRLDILVEDYANDEVMQSENWLMDMKASIERLQKRLGLEMVRKIVTTLENGEWREVASYLLTYYDKLYDKHIKNSTGTGSGTGTRSGIIHKIGDDSSEMDVPRYCEMILQRLGESS